MSELLVSKAQHQRRYRNLRIKIYLWAGLVLLAAILTVYSIFKLPFLQIQKIEISGRIDLEALQAEVFKNKLAQFLGIDNFLSWPKEIGGVLIEKDYFTGTLKGITDSPERFIIWCPSAGSGQAPSGASECYWVNRSGIAVETAPDTEGSAIPKVKDSRETALLEGKHVLSKNLFSNLAKIIDGFAKLPVSIADFNFDDRLQELTANGARGERIIFSLRFAPSERAFSYLKDLISSGKLRASEYVDLTVENRIYLKSR